MLTILTVTDKTNWAFELGDGARRLHKRNCVSTLRSKLIIGIVCSNKNIAHASSSHPMKAYRMQETYVRDILSRS